jgi:hypothetical protein
MAGDAVRRGMRVLTLPTVLFAGGLVGHVVGDGATPPGWVLVALYTLTVVVVAPFAGAAPSPARVVALLIGGQGVLHAALQLLGGTFAATTVMPGAAIGPATGSAPASSHLMMHQGAGASHGPVMSLMGGWHLVMLLAHLAAAVVVGVWLAAGERALWMLLALTARPLVDAWRTVTAVVRGGVDALVVSCPRLQIGWGLRRVVNGRVWTVGFVARRGPPLGCRSLTRTPPSDGLTADTSGSARRSSEDRRPS